MIEESIHYELRHDADITALVSNRIYPLLLPQEVTYPAISFQLISSQRIHDIGGPTGRAHPRIQIDCWAETYSGVKDLSNEVRLCLDGFKGTINAETDIGGIYLDGERDIYEVSIDIYRVTMDFFVPHGESTT